MSLNWSIENVKDNQELIDDANESAITESLIWLTMAVGIGEITEDTVDEFVNRATIVQALHGAYMFKGAEPYYITRDHIVRRIGLHTNVGGPEPRTKWLKRWTSDVRDTERQQEHRNNLADKRKAG